MNDVTFSLNTLRSLIDEARRDDMNIAERAGLNAGARFLCLDFIDHIANNKPVDGYALEKARGVMSHMASALGFDITNGHSKDMHLNWALGEVRSLDNVLTEGKAE